MATPAYVNFDSLGKYCPPADPTWTKSFTTGAGVNYLLFIAATTSFGPSFTNDVVSITAAPSGGGATLNLAALQPRQSQGGGSGYLHVWGVACAPGTTYAVVATFSGNPDVAGLLIGVKDVGSVGTLVTLTGSPATLTVNGGTGGQALVITGWRDSSGSVTTPGAGQTEITHLEFDAQVEGGACWGVGTGPSISVPLTGSSGSGSGVYVAIPFLPIPPPPPPSTAPGNRLYGGVRAGKTGVSLGVLLRRDDTGKGKIGVLYGAVAASYTRQGAAPVAITMAALASAVAAHSPGGWWEERIAASPTMDATIGAGGSSPSSAASGNFNYTPAGVISAVLVSVHLNHATVTVTGITYGGVAMTLLKRQAVTGQPAAVEIWGLVGATVPQGLVNIAWTLSASTESYVGVRSAKNVGSFGTAVGAESGTNTLTVNAVSAVGDIVLDAITTYGNPAPFYSPDASQTQQFFWNPGGNVIKGYGSSKPGAAVTTLTWTRSSGTVYGSAIAAVALQADPAAGTGAPGLYRLDVPDAAFAAGADWVAIGVVVAGAYEYVERLGLESRRSLRAGGVYPGLPFLLQNADGSPATGKSVTAQRILDGAAAAAMANAVVELAGGLYKIDLAAADTDAIFGCYLFTASGVVPRAVLLTFEP